MPEFKTEPDLCDVETLKRELTDLNVVLTQYATSQKNGMLGHSNPEYFFGRISRAVAAAVAKITDLSQVPVTPEPVVVEFVETPVVTDGKNRKK